MRREIGVKGAEDLKFQVQKGRGGERLEEIGERLGAGIARRESEANAQDIRGGVDAGEILGIALKGDDFLTAPGPGDREGNLRSARAALAGDGEVEGAIEEQIAGGDFQILTEGVQGFKLDALCAARAEGGEGRAGDARVLGGAGDGEPALGQQHGEVWNQHGVDLLGGMIRELYNTLDNLSRRIKTENERNTIHNVQTIGRYEEGVRL